MSKKHIKRYRVTLEFRAKVRHEVEAESEEAAIAIARGQTDGNDVWLSSETYDERATEP